MLLYNTLHLIKLQLEPRQVCVTYLDGDDVHSRGEAAVLSDGILILCDHHDIHLTYQVVMVPNCCRVHTPTHTHTHTHRQLAC